MYVRHVSSTLVFSLPPHRLILKFCLYLSLSRFIINKHSGRTTQHTLGAITHRVSSTGAPQPDGVLNKVVRMKIRHYRQIYVDRTDPIVFLPITVSTSGHVYEDFGRLFFLQAHREVSILVGELPEESEQFRFFRVSRLDNLNGSVGLILVKDSPIRVTIPIHLSTWSFIPLPRFLNSRRVSPLLNQSLVFIPEQST